MDMTTNKESEDRQLQQYVSAMPKVELHAHLNGCIRDETLFDLARERNVELPSKLFHLGGHQQSSSSKDDAEEDHSFSFMYNVKPRSLTDCFDMFQMIPLVVNDLDALERITKEALQDFSNHHVVYLELRSTPKRINNTLTKRQYIETILRVMKTFQDEDEQRYHHELTTSNKQARLPMTCRFLVSIDRSGSAEEAEENVALAVEFFRLPDSMVVGVEIGGNPTKNDFRDFQPVLAKARQAGLKTTVHCAEVPVGEETDKDPQLVKAYKEVLAIFDFGPDRLGHALLLPSSLRERLMRLEIKVPVESCPTSNVMTLELAKHMGGDLIHGLQQHPQLKHWLESNYPISIGTDDPGVFNTNATQELLLLARALGVSQDQLRRIVLDSIDHAFCSQELKGKIKERMVEFFGSIII